jgi:hypothetical protein
MNTRPFLSVKNVILVMLIGAPALSFADVAFFEDFSGTPAGTTWGNAAYSGDALHLTDAVNSQNGSWAWAPGEALPYFDMSCKVLIGGGTATGADGMSFSYSDFGDGQALGDTGDPDPGLSVRLRTFDENFLEVNYNNGNVARVYLSQVILRQNTWVPFRVRVDQSGNIEVWYNYTRHVNETISGWNPQADWRFGFGGRTGGSNDNHWVDDLSVYSSTTPAPVSITRDSGTATVGIGTSSVDYKVLFSDRVANVDTSDFSVTTISGSPAAALAAMTPLVNFSNDFSSTVAPGDVLGSAGLESGHLRLTNNDGSVSGSWYYQPPEPVTGFRAAFDMYIGGGSGADGMSFVYAQEAQGGFGAEGPFTGQGLVVAFDTYPNEGESTPDITVRYNLTDIARTGWPLRTGDWRAVEVLVSKDGLCGVWHGGNLVLACTIPGWAPRSSWEFGLGANTGGANDNHWADNLVIQSNQYTATLDSLGGAGEVRLDLNSSNNITNTRGFGLTPSTLQGEVYTLDFVRPDVTLASSAGDPVNSAIVVTVELSETPDAFGAGNISADNAVVSGFNGVGRFFDFTLTPQSVGTFSCVVNADEFSDSAGNGNTASNTLNREYDNIPPDVTLNCAAGDPVNSDIAVTATISEEVTTFDSSDISTVNASVSSFGGSGQTYNFILAPAGEGAFSCSVEAGEFTDPADNPNTVSNTISRTYDSIAPDITLSTAAGDPVNGAISVDVSITESDNSFGESDLGPVNAVVSGFSGSGDTWSFTLTPQSEGAFSVAVAADAFTDDAGNGNTASNSVASTFDETPPDITLSAAAADPVNSAITVSAEISEAVSTFSTGNISASNASVSGFSGSGENYSFTLTPVADGTFSCHVAADEFADPAGNSNTVSNTVSRTFDGTLPAVQSRVPAAGATVASLTSVEVLFNDTVTGLAAGDLTVNGSAATDLTGSGAGPYSFTGFTVPGDGAVDTALQAGSAVDDAGNAFTGDSWAYTVNSTQPSVQLTSADVNDGALVNSPAAFSFTATFSEAVTGFSTGDVTVTNAVSPVTGFSGSDAVYTFTVTPQNDGEVTVQIPAAAANAAAPPNNATLASTTFSFTYDSTAPVITLNGDTDVTVDCGAGYTDPGVASAVDAMDGDLTGLVITSGDTAGAQSAPAASPFIITYEVTDNAGNTARLDRTITVADNCPLAVTADSETDQILEPGAELVLRVQVTGMIGTVVYDWQKDNGAKAFQTLNAPDSPVYEDTDFTEEDAGLYRCVVSDSVTTITSAVFDIDVTTGVPAAGLAGILLLAGICAAGGACQQRRRKNNSF